MVQVIKVLAHSELKRLLAYDPETGLLTWKVKPSKKVNVGDTIKTKSHDYLVVRIYGKQYLQHRLIWFYVYGTWPKNQIDHKNLNKIDNRIDNLREATNQENHFNLPLSRRNKSGYKGVHWSKNRNKWRVEYTLNCKRFEGGYFDNVEDAALKYRELTKKLHGEFANYN